MELLYYPGCTLKTKAVDLEKSAVAAMDVLGVHLKELARWNCCGSVHSLAQDDLVHQLAPVRNLIRVQEQNADKIATLCPFCYNSLKQANYLMKQDGEKRKTLTDYMEEEPPYRGEVRVLHLIEVLRDEIGWEKIAAAVKVPLSGLKVASYYGCTLLRPKEIALDNIERPQVLDNLMESIGAKPVIFPFATECCGSFQTVGNPSAVAERAQEIISSAVTNGAQAIVTTCPLCHYNLTSRQAELKQKSSESTGILIVYFSQLLALSLGVNPEICLPGSDSRLKSLLSSLQHV
jgi:heterodisulfide reductase subunit B2